MTTDLAGLLAERGVLVADGGMGTSLFEMGLTSGDSPELWNVEHPDRVAAVHAGFVAAGADILLSNTFGGTASRLELHDLQHRVAELNAAGVRVTREVADAAGRPVVVAGSIGPTGALFEPLGPLTHDDGVALFAAQAAALAEGGADVLWIETLSATEELAAAVAGARTTGLPVVTTMSFDTNGRTMMGVAPAGLADWWRAADTAPVAMGSNCGVGPADNVLAGAEIHAAAPEVAVVVKGNCGVPEFVDGKLWYPAATDDMTAYAELALEAGARIIGACCGSLPAHIAQIRSVVDRYESTGVAVDRGAVESRLGTVSRPAERSRERRGRRRAGTVA